MAIERKPASLARRVRALVEEIQALNPASGQADQEAPSKIVPKKFPKFPKKFPKMEKIKKKKRVVLT